MSLPLPNLDDRTYADLIAEARTMIPSLSPEWTDHNPTDPGIAIIELLAWLVEMSIYRTNHVSDEMYTVFLKLLNGPGWQRNPNMSREVSIRSTIRALRERYRAVTADDYEYLALNTWPDTASAKLLTGGGKLRRAQCIPRANLEMRYDQQSVDGHLSLIVWPDSDPSELTPQPTRELTEKLWQFLDERRLLGTRHHVVGPRYRRVTVMANLQLRSDAREDKVRNSATQVLQAFFHPLYGGSENTGWPLGRPVYLSEVYDLLDRVSGVDFVQSVSLASPSFEQPDRSREIRDAKQLFGIRLDAYEVVEIIVEPAKRLMLGVF